MKKLPTIRLYAERKPAVVQSGTNFSGVAALLGVLITLIGAFLFAASKAYLNAYLAEYGVDSNLFAFGIQDAIYNGSISASVGFAIFAVGCILTGTLALFFEISVYYLRRLSSLFFRFVPGGGNANTSIGKKWHSDAPLFIGAGMFIGASYFLYLVLMVPIEHYGQAGAKKQIEAIRKNDLTELRKQRFHRMEVERGDSATTQMDSGVKIICQAEHFCVLRNEEKTILVPMKNIKRATLVPI